MLVNLTFRDTEKNNDVFEGGLEGDYKIIDINKDNNTITLSTSGRHLQKIIKLSKLNKIAINLEIIP